MKKAIVFSFFLACLGFASLHAQKVTSTSGAESTAPAGGSTARTKGVGKGTPLVQRQSGASTTASPAPAPAAEKSTKGAAIAPATTAPVTPKAGNAKE